MKYTYMILAGAISTSLAMTGCTTNPYTGENQGSRAGYGAAAGAAGGAALGAILGGKDRGKSALIGAGAGALAGAGAGYYMDRQQAKLREQLQGTGVSVTRNGDNLILNMPGNITFAFGRAEINSNFYSVLNSVVQVLREFDKTAIQVAGHTDSVGSDQANLQLSQDRAQSVANYLVSQGVNPARVSATGYGKTRPVADNSTENGRAANRRVELTLIPQGG